MENFKRLAVYSLLLSFITISSTLNMLTPTQPIRDGRNETLVSVAGTFEAGFFSLNSKSHYVGIWYKNISPRTVVWVANRENPLTDSSGVFEVNSDGLSIIDSTGTRIWSSNASKTTEKPVVQLLESGNLVVKDGKNLESILWQSFDHPGDTFLPGMKLGSNFKTGQSLALTSWKALEDPSPGEYSMGIDTHGLPQLLVRKGGSILYRAGSWNGLSFTGTPALTNYSFMKFLFVHNEEEVFYENEILNSSILMRSRLIPQGYPFRFTWSNQTKIWENHYSGSPMDECATYGLCGANTNCNSHSTKICECLTGFTAKSQDSDGSFGGCARTTQLVCSKGDRFQKYEAMKLPDTSSSWYDKTISLQECEKLCLSNYSCTAYANLNISGGGSGCLHWFDNIMDTRKLAEGGQDFYLRLLTASELNLTNKNSQPSNKKKLAGIVVGSAIFIMGTIVFGLIICIQKKKITHPGIVKLIYWKDKREKEDIDLPIFDFSTISNTTNHFSERNKLGQGGFGPVYKGLLADGQEIAVKRLSKTSRQGTQEFKNEVLLIAKLQHRNLVKLLGCSIHQSEKLLIYELMPNRSLDYFVFDSTRSKLLDWTMRLEIIGGIARGLLYLHQDSRLRIIHRDLKTSNILLDNNMNPKISDFGLAKTFGGDQAEEEANTNRVMGTHGYMPPEYAVHGSYSVKSDVFSFGVIILEIISGRKNRGFSDPDHHLNLLGHAWRLWNEEKPIELVDKLLDDSVTPSEILRCVHVGLLCVQQRPEDRPNMASVVLMLNGEKLLPKPSQPGFYTERNHPNQVDSSSINVEGCSLNEVSISLLEAR